MKPMFESNKGNYSVDDAIDFFYYLITEEDKAHRYHYEVRIKPMSLFFNKEQINKAHEIILGRRINEIKSKMIELEKELTFLETKKHDIDDTKNNQRTR